MKKVVAIGDSHVRSFAKNPNFLPLFAGPGKEICFIDEKSYNHTLSTIKKILSNFDKEDIFMLVFGEPDCRWRAGKGWHPWLTDKSTGLDEEGLEASATRFLKLIEELVKDGYKNLCIYNATPSKSDGQNKMVVKWNDIFRDYCEDEDILFIDIFDKVTDEKGSALDEYMADVIHLNDKATKLVLDILIDNDVINENESEDYNYNYEDVKSKFVFNSKFNCFTYKE